MSASCSSADGGPVVCSSNGGVEEATICHYCGVVFSYRQALDKHIAACPVATATAAALAPEESTQFSLNERQQQQQRRFQCDECGQCFKSKAALARHRNVHDVNRPFLCHCGQAYKRFKHLQRHLLLEHDTIVRDDNPEVVVVVPSAVQFVDTHAADVVL